jgi:hypothetical protein
VRTAVAIALLVRSTLAFADSDDIVTRPLVLARGQLEAQLWFETNLQLAQEGSPTSLAPDVWYGLTDRFTVGITHSNASLDRIDASASICVVHREDVCDRYYRGGAIEARWSWRTGVFSVAPRARLLLRDTDPMKPAIALGALVRWTRGRFALQSDPYIRTGLANTDLGNRTQLTVPLYILVQPTCRWLVGFHLGWESDLAVARDGWHGPLGLIVKARATESVDLTLHGGFTSLVGVQNNIKQRALMLSVGWRGFL